MTFFQRIKTPFTESPAEEQARLQPRARPVGELLQERREDLGLDLEEIGAMLRIKPAYLAALEQGRANDLPGPTYAIGFIRAYAEFLGLDSEQVLVRFKAEAADVTAPPDLALPVPLGERSLPGGALVLVALITALSGYGIWYYLSTEARDRPQRVAAVPASLRAASPQAPALASPTQPQSAAAASAGDSSAEQVTPSSGSAAGSPQSSPALATVPTEAASPTPPPQPATAPSPTAPSSTNLSTGALLEPIPRGSGSVSQPEAQASPPQQGTGAAVSASPTPAAGAAPVTTAGPQTGHISIRALADCWIQVRAADQSVVFSRVLKSGEVYNVPARAGLSLRTGNAGALEISVDGKTVPPIGAIGALRRDVALDPTELAAGTAVHG